MTLTVGNGPESKNVPNVDAVKGATLYGVWVGFRALTDAKMSGPRRFSRAQRWIIWSAVILLALVL
jgi:hypothetical protein